MVNIGNSEGFVSKGHPAFLWHARSDSVLEAEVVSQSVVDHRRSGRIGRAIWLLALPMLLVAYLIFHH